MIKSVLTFIAAVVLALLVAFTIPLSSTDIGTNPVKEAVAFATAKIGSIRNNLSILLAIFVTLQGFLLALAALSLLSQTTWLILSRSKAPLNIIDAALRNYPQTFYLFFKQPFKNSSAVVLLVFLPLIIDAVQHATVQTLIVQGVAANLGTAQYSYINTSTVKLHFSQIAATAAANGISSVAKACNKQTRVCGTELTNSTTSLISCDSEVDCTQEISSYHDFDMKCIGNEAMGTLSGTSNAWLNSTISKRSIPIPGGDPGTILVWAMRRVTPNYGTDGNRTTPTLVATVQCQISCAWVKRVESKLRGTLSKAVLRLYDSAEIASAANTTNVDPLSNLRGKSMSHLASTMGYLDLALSGKVSGTCSGLMDSSAAPYFCGGSLHLMSWASEPSRVENDVAMLEQEMRFTVEMIMKHLFVNAMPATSSSFTCKACSTRQAQWASMPATIAFFGAILGIVLVFSGVSIYLDAVKGCSDALITAEKLLTVFGEDNYGWFLQGPDVSLHQSVIRKKHGWTAVELTANGGSINITLRVLHAMLVTMQGIVVTPVQTVWLILSRPKAPSYVIEAALRKYPQTFYLLILVECWPEVVDSVWEVFWVGNSNHIDG
ncbi:hypothetical protein HDU81_000059 [Chytriomyces hyalinus]|nr:hypothetical protein HDU81_000059 [Chytriomyces hyalinus]